METVELAARLVNLLLDAVGVEKAQHLVSEETKRRAYVVADLAAEARKVVEGL